MLLRKTYGIDLGSSSIKVYSFFKNKSYMEKNMIASKGRRIIAVGNEAYDMFEKAPANIVVNSPMAFGMIANLELQEIALYSMMKKIDHFLGIGSDIFCSAGYDCSRETGILPCRKWPLAQAEPGIYGRGSNCRRNCHGCGPKPKCWKYDRKYWSTEYTVLNHHGWENHHCEKNSDRWTSDE